MSAVALEAAPPGLADAATANRPASDTPGRTWQPLVRDRAFDLQLRFNLFPATYAHASWIARMGRHLPLAEGLDDSPFWVRRLSLALLQACELDQEFDFDFSDRTKNIALLDAAVLERCARLMAGLLVREQIRHVVRGADMAAIERALGREALRFALAWTAPLPVLGYVFHPHGAAFPDNEGWTRRAVGLASALMGVAPRATLARMQLRFPCDWGNLERPVLQEQDRSRLAALFVAVLNKAAPEHAWLLAQPAPERAAATTGRTAQ